MQLNVHLHHLFLHMLYMRPAILDQTLELPQIRSQSRHTCLGAEAPLQQPVTLNTLEPSCIAHIRFASRDILDIAGIYKDYVKTMLLKDFISRDPVNTCGIHRYTDNASCFKPASHCMQVASECTKLPDRIIIGFRVDRRHVHCRTNIDCGNPGTVHYEACTVTKYSPLRQIRETRVYGNQTIEFRLLSNETLPNTLRHAGTLFSFEEDFSHKTPAQRAVFNKYHHRASVSGGDLNGTASCGFSESQPVAIVKITAK
jgi:hypothetical protein